MRIPPPARALVALVLGLAVLRFAAAALAPIAKDESYYLCWSTALDWGYFDHPPAVAWLGTTAALAPSSAFAGRLGGLLAGTLALPFCFALFRRAGIADTRALIAATTLAAFNLAGLTCGVLVVPDTLFFVAWCAALHEAAAALDGRPRRWLSAGAATGLGLLSKYMMVLALPVLFLAALRGKPRELRTIWPWAGVLVALAVFSPHLVWNARNDWIPVRFQLEHGLQGGDAIRVGAFSQLPSLEEPGESEIALARRFGYTGAPAEPDEPEDRSPARALANLANYAGGLATWWGALIVLAIGWLVAKLRGAPHEPQLHAHLRPLLFWSAVFPIGFFAVTSLRAPVQANWPAAYIVGACAFLASYAARHPRLLFVGCAANAAVLLAVAIHAHTPLRASNSDRVLKETRGYRELADVVARTDGPVFVDRHQTASMLRFYLPGREVTQWPGLTRPSEFVRRPEWNALTRSDLERRGSFWLLTAGALPPGINGFHAAEMRRVTTRVVRERIETFVIDVSEPLPPDEAGKALHRWHLTRYVANGAR